MSSKEGTYHILQYPNYLIFYILFHGKVILTNQDRPVDGHRHGLTIPDNVLAIFKPKSSCNIGNGKHGPIVYNFRFNIAGVDLAIDQNFLTINGNFYPVIPTTVRILTIGVANDEIVSHLGISLKTDKTHIQHLLDKI